MDKKENKQMCLAAYSYLMLGQDLEDVADQMDLSVAEVQRLLTTFKARIESNVQKTPRRSAAKAYWQALQKQPQDDV